MKAATATSGPAKRGNAVFRCQRIALAKLERRSNPLLYIIKTCVSEFAVQAPMGGGWLDGSGVAQVRGSN